jgi:glycosyltransferase involved in cell wall biosynthesis
MGINVCGFLKGEYGVGESSRAFYHAVKETGLPSAAINIQSGDQRNSDDSAGEFSERNPYSVNLMTFSFDYARRFYRDRGKRFFESKKNVALWYWELESFPPRWHSAFDYYDEIWVASEFCRTALAAVSPIPIHKMTYPLYLGSPAQPDRARFSLCEDDYVFLFSFDFLSTLARKNPLGLITAFRDAFRPDDDVTLVLKSINSGHDPDGKRLVQLAIEGLKVKWIDDHLSGVEMRSLFASADAYVSLHRSEGLGLGMAQAMSLGKPVIATGYSGNLEFMNEGNSLLVKYDQIELDRDYGSVTKPSAYEKGSFWAEPDLAHAAEQMRRLFENRDRGAEVGARGCEEIRAALDPARTVLEIVERVIK